jgi:protein ImuB
VLPEPAPLLVRTADGQTLTVDERLALNGAPASAAVGREAPVEVTGWAGPWPVQERWWAPEEATSLARFQLALADGRVLLAAYADGRWRVEASYD